LRQLSITLNEKEHERAVLQSKIDSIHAQQELSTQVYKELKAQYPSINNAIIQPSVIITDSSILNKTYLILLSAPGGLSYKDKVKLENWLKVRLNQADVKLIFQK